MTQWTADKCPEHPDHAQVTGGGLVLACLPSMRQAVDLANAHNGDALHAANQTAALADRTEERDAARASALRAVDRTRELEEAVLQMRAADGERMNALRVDLDALRVDLDAAVVERDEARRQNVVLNMRLVGDVGEVLDTAMQRWDFVEARHWRVPPLSEQERALVQDAYNAVGVGEGQYAGAPELLQVLRTLPEALAVRVVGQLQQVADDGRAYFERGHDGLRERLRRTLDELSDLRTVAAAAERELTPVRKQRDDLAGELARVKTQNGIAAQEELRAIELQLARGAVDGYPDTVMGRAVADLCGKVRDLHQQLQAARVALAAAEAARLDATAVALATLTRITKPLKRLRRAPQESTS